MIETLFSVLDSALSIWAHKEKNKYRDRLIDLKRRHREESAKPDNERSDAVLDNIRFELETLALAFAGSVASDAK